MSYSQELKQYLRTIDEKKPCCAASYNSGINLIANSAVCERDTGAWLRGAFIASGSMTDPAKHYHLSFTAAPEALDLIESALDTAGISASHGSRRGQAILYLRDSAKIEDFMAVIGAVKYTLALMEHKVMKELSADANRQANADVANCAKLADASARQLAAINRLVAMKQYARLPAELRETAELRLAHPDLSLEELRKVSPTPITKSGLNHRLRRIVEAAEGK